jgi:Icc-related predicted phosphoesterase
VFWKPANDVFRIYYACDLHGSERCFRKFLNAAPYYHADALVLGGDLTGKAIVPVVRRGDHWEADLFGQHYVLETEAERAAVEDAIGFNGFYPYRTTEDELELLGRDAAYREQVFADLMRASLERWLAIAEGRGAGAVPVYAIAGNDDAWLVDDILRSSPAIRYNDETVLDLGPLTVVGCSRSNPTPWQSPRECEEEALYERLSRLVGSVPEPRRAVFNFHVPPYNSGLDSAPRLTPDLSVVRVGAEPVLEPVGSRAVRRLIEEVQPLLGLHGHIHESPAVRRLGRTRIVNPGSRYAEGVLDGALVLVTKDRVVACQLVTG